MTCVTLEAILKTNNRPCLGPVGLGYEGKEEGRKGREGKRDRKERIPSPVCICDGSEVPNAGDGSVCGALTWQNYSVPGERCELLRTYVRVIVDD